MDEGREKGNRQPIFDEMAAALGGNLCFNAKTLC